MSKTFEKLLKGKFDLQESYPSLILGAIIVVILGLLVANFFSRRNQGAIDQAEQIQETLTTQEPAAGSEYTIRENDSLSKISQSVYGTLEFWPTIAKINNISNPNKILVGSKLQLPAKAELEQGRQAMTSTSYEVKAGDTFFTIAQSVYGDGAKWAVLHKANGGRRLPNGNPLVFSGTTIVVPR